MISSIFIFTYEESRKFNGERAYEHVKYQVEQGPRTLNSEAHDIVAEWIESNLKRYKWDVEIQEGHISGISIKNIIGKKGNGRPWIIIASHYDSRQFADRDLNPDNRKLPVEGANDGASSVAILLELARVIPRVKDKQIWLVFFDAEDNGNIPGFDWILGSRYFVDELIEKPDKVVILDMVGDKDLNIHLELNSNPIINSEIWNAASDLGYTQFIPTYKYDLIDDHIPFIEAGISAVDVIDFSYPYWHTTLDTLDKVSVDSLKIVGDTIVHWLEYYLESNGIKSE
jgi:Zn-dependent M28 family amino/carboxypeptidase